MSYVNEETNPSTAAMRSELLFFFSIFINFISLYCVVVSLHWILFSRNNYEKPTPIQAQAIPAIMSGRDLIGKGCFS